MDEPALYLDAGLICSATTQYRQTADQVAWARGVIEAEIALGSEGAAADDARRICGWVRQRLRPAASGVMLGRGLGLRYGRCLSVQEALEKGTADCVTHSVLACFLLRSRGIPARLTTERVYTGFDPLAAPMALLPNSIVGPFSEGHVWLEFYDGSCWQAADAELGILGSEEWVSKRVVSGVPFSAAFYGLTFGSFWHFPLTVHAVDQGGNRSASLSRHYLIDAVRTRLAEPDPDEEKALRVWERGVAYFEGHFAWDRPFPGLRLVLELPRLRRMGRALHGLLSD